MDTIRSLSNELLALETAQGLEGPRKHQPDAAAEPARRHDDDGAQPARAVHVPAPDRGARPPARRAAERGPGRARPPRGRGRGAAPRSSRSSRCTCRPCARTSAATWRASCTTSSAHCSRPPSSMPRASRHASARRTPEVDRADGAPERGAQQRHRAEAPHHRGPASVVAQQPGADRGARDPRARVQRSDASSRSTATCEPVELDEPSAELTVYRLVQEALTNIAKYAKASRVRSWSRRATARSRSACATTASASIRRHRRLATHGLLGMQFRVESESGEMTIESAPGCGTAIFASLPETAPTPVPVESGKQVVAA